MSTKPVYYTGDGSTTELALEAGFISAIEQWIDEAINDPLKSVTKAFKFGARANVYSQLLVDVLDITINAEHNQVTIGSSVVDLTLGLVASEIAVAIATGIAIQVGAPTAVVTGAGGVPGT